ncbi:MAG TPA: MASE3 domain-containing protein, partial [Candidatus Deferrimicrobiaceae bacterium]
MDESAGAGRLTGSPADNGFLPQGKTDPSRTPGPLRTGKWLSLALGLLLVPAALFGAYRNSPGLAHDLAETFSAIVACGTFMLTWNARRIIDNHYFIFLGIAYLFVGVIDYLHCISFSGVFASGLHGVSIEFWFASRYLQSLALLAAPLFAVRKVQPAPAFAGISAVALALVGMAYYGIFPDYYVPGEGLTYAKRVSDYLVSGVQAVSIALLWAVRERFDRDVFRLLVLSVVFSIAAEMSAIVYTDAFVYNSVAGHSLKVASFFLVYKAVIEAGLVRPYTTLFRNLEKSAQEVRVARDLLDSQVVARTADLKSANARLEEELAERRRAMAIRELILDLHQLTRPKDNVRDLLSSLAVFLKNRFGFEAVGVRFRDASDYPYFATVGFPREFVQMEGSLCSPDRIAPGEDATGESGPYECVCGAVIERRHDPTLPFFSPAGTFWTDNASDLLAASETYRSIAVRGRCVREGYESIA